MILGRTGLEVTRTSFGVLPLQRVDLDTAEKILKRAYEAGIAYYDTARAYSDSEEKIGRALSTVRKDIVISTKTNATNRKDLFSQLETSLKMLKTDYIDIYQLHNPSSVPLEGSEVYEALLKAKAQGKIRFIGITNHNADLGREAILSSLYDTLQFPFCTLSDDRDLELISLASENSIGLIAMKALSGGLIKNARAAFAYLRQFENLVPIWGVQRMSELEEFIELDKEEPVLDEYLKEVIEKDREELKGDFCRACGYCMPCTIGIEIPMAARMKLLLRRMPFKGFMSDEWYERMRLIEKCTNCGKCKSKCPYNLDTPELLRRNLEDYLEFYEMERKKK